MEAEKGLIRTLHSGSAVMGVQHPPGFCLSCSGAFGSAPASFGSAPAAFGSAPSAFGSTPPAFGSAPAAFGASSAGATSSSFSFGSATPSSFGVSAAPTTAATLTPAFGSQQSGIAVVLLHFLNLTAIQGVVGNAAACCRRFFRLWCTCCCGGLLVWSRLSLSFGIFCSRQLLFSCSRCAPVALASRAIMGHDTTPGLSTVAAGSSPLLLMLLHIAGASAASQQTLSFGATPSSSNGAFSLGPAAATSQPAFGFGSPAPVATSTGGFNFSASFAAPPATSTPAAGGVGASTPLLGGSVCVWCTTLCRVFTIMIHCTGCGGSAEFEVIVQTGCWCLQLAAHRVKQHLLLASALESALLQQAPQPPQVLAALHLGAPPQPRPPATRLTRLRSQQLVPPQPRPPSGCPDPQLLPPQQVRRCRCPLTL